MDGERKRPERLTQEEILFLLGAVDYDPLLARGKDAAPEKDAPDSSSGHPPDSPGDGKENAHFRWQAGERSAGSDSPGRKA